MLDEDGGFGISDEEKEQLLAEMDKLQMITLHDLYFQVIKIFH
jgi:hypothetical protein